MRTMPIEMPAEDETLRAAEKLSKSDLHRRVIAFLREHSGGYSTEIQDALNLGVSTVRAQLRDLMEMGVVYADREAAKGRARKYYVREERLVELLVMLVGEFVADPVSFAKTVLTTFGNAKN